MGEVKLGQSYNTRLYTTSQTSSPKGTPRNLTDKEFNEVADLTTEFIRKYNALTLEQNTLTLEKKEFEAQAQAVDKSLANLQKTLMVTLFYNSLGLQVPSKAETINQIYTDYLSNNTIKEIREDNKKSYELTNLASHLYYYQTHASTVCDLKGFTTVPNLQPILQEAAKPDSSIQKIVFNTQIKESRSLEEMQALINARNARAGNLEVLLSKPQANKENEENQATAGKVTETAPNLINSEKLNALKEKLKGKKIKGKPAVEVLDDYLRKNPQATLNNAISFIKQEGSERDLSAYKEKMKGATINGRPAFDIFKEYLQSNPNASLKEGVNYLKKLQYG